MNNGMFMNYNNFINNGSSLNNSFLNFYPNLSNSMALNNNMNMFNFMMYYLKFMAQNNNNFNRMTFVNTNQNNGIYNNNNSNSNSYSNNNMTGILPRNNRTDQISPFIGYSGEIVNLFFQASTGYKINMLVPNDVKLKDVLVQYILKIGLGPDVIDKDIYFLCNGNKIKKNENMTLREKCFLSGTVIIVIDKKGIMGA